jgi:hypothetical protein
MKSMQESSRPPSLPYPSVQRLAHATSFCLGGMAFVLVLTIDFLGPDLYTRSFERDGLPVSYTEIHLNHNRLTFVAKASLVLGAAAAVMWLLWQSGSQANVRALGAMGTRFHPAAVVLAWLVRWRT